MAKLLIKDIYGWKMIDNAESSLLKHMNRILMKSPEELKLDDVCLLVRQEMMLEIAVPKAIRLLMKNPKSGDNYDFSLLFNLSEMKADLSAFRDGLRDLTVSLDERKDGLGFDSPEDRKDFLKALELLKDKCK